MQPRFNLNNSEATRLEAEYLEAIRRTIERFGPEAAMVGEVRVEGAYPDTTVVVTTSPRAHVHDEQRFSLWDETFQSGQEPEDPSHVAVELVAQVFEEGAC
jgi:hypothetical protein